MGSTTSSLEFKALSNPAVLWVTVGGVGFIKPAPGTWGSVVALILWWFFLADLSLPLQAAIACVYAGLSWALCAYVCRRFDIDDAPEIVADEVAGMWLTLMWLPQVWWIALIGFALFRLLDISKPYVIGWLDREVRGAGGVMVDDVVAGLVAGVVLKVALLLAGLN